MTTRLTPRRRVETPPYITPGPNAAPDNDEPLPDAMYQEPFFSETVQVVRTFLIEQDDTLVSGDSAVYYRDENGRQRNIRPDCYVAFGVDQIAIRRRNGYFIEEVGKPPNLVLEIASESTYRNDIGPKRELYRRLRVGESWLFDATGGDYYGAPLMGERLVNGVYQPIEISRDSNGVSSGYSHALGLYLCWDGGFLRFLDPAAGAYLRNLAESERDLLTAEQGRQAAERSRQAAEAENRRLREQIRRMRERLSGASGDASDRSETP